MRFGVLVSTNMVFSKVNWSCLKTLHFCRFKRVFALALLTLFFLLWPFRWLFFLFFHLLYFFLLLFHKSSFYVLVIVSVVLGFLGFVMCYLLDVFFLAFAFFVEGLSVR